MPTEPLIDPATLDLDRPIADRAAIRAVNPQRFEMEQLDGIVLLDPERMLVVGYKDVRADEFWCRGHFPGDPMLPGVIMCEAAAQLCSYYVMSQHVIGDDQVMGFGGLDEVRFRSVVRPGDRLVLASRGKRVSRRASSFDVQGYVGNAVVFEAGIIGVPLQRGAG
jgi:3-hydroxyacyl-[acyl-carrier-protein] dehydratase